MISILNVFVVCSIYEKPMCFKSRINGHTYPFLIINTNLNHYISHSPSSYFVCHPIQSMALYGLTISLKACPDFEAHTFFVASHPSSQVYMFVGEFECISLCFPSRSTVVIHSFLFFISFFLRGSARIPLSPSLCIVGIIKRLTQIGLYIWLHIAITIGLTI